VNDRDIRKILRIASNSTMTSREIAQQAGVTTNVRNVQRILQQSDLIKRKKRQKKPPNGN